MLCIMPSSSEFLARLINAARGLLLPRSENCGRPLLETAYLLFEFSVSHRIGSGLFLSVAGSVARSGSNADMA
jgi:hypothetical protein